MPSTKHALWAVLLAAVGGCAIQRPTVTYTVPQSGVEDRDVLASADAGGQLFDIPTTQVVVTTAARAQQAAARAQPAAAAQPAPGRQTGNASNNTNAAPAPQGQTITVGATTYTIQVVPQESGNEFRVAGQNSFLATTLIQLQYRPSSLIPSSVQVSFTDQTVTRVTEIGTALATIASAAAPFVAAAIAPPRAPACPKAAPLTDFKLTVRSPSSAGSAVDGQPCWVYSLQFVSTSKPTGAITLDTFKAQTEPLHVFPVPACRDAVVTLSPNAAVPDPKVLPVSFKVRVATPDYLYPVLLPQKGAINLDPVCGASVSDTPVNPTSQTLDAINAALTKAQAIESSLVAKKAAASAGTGTGHAAPKNQ